MEERKKRVGVKSQVFLTRSAKAEGLDLSEDGLYVYCRHPFVVESIIDISFTLDQSVIPVTARVVHSEPGVGMGVKFLEVAASDVEKIKSHVEHESGVVELKHVENHPPEK